LTDSRRQNLGETLFLGVRLFGGGEGGVVAGGPQRW